MCVLNCELFQCLRTGMSIEQFNQLQNTDFCFLVTMYRNNLDGKLRLGARLCLYQVHLMFLNVIEERMSSVLTQSFQDHSQLTFTFRQLR